MRVASGPEEVLLSLAAYEDVRVLTSHHYRRKLEINPLLLMHLMLK